MSFSLFSILPKTPMRSALLQNGSRVLRIATVVVASCGVLACQQMSAQAAPPAAKEAPKPDVLVFTNGDQLTGKFEKGAGDSITFKSDMAGEITVPLAKIKELRASGNYALLRKDTKTPTTDVKIGLLSYEDGNVVISEDGTAVEKVPTKNVDFLIDQTTYHQQMTAKQGLLHGWKGGITGGATIVRSTQNGSTYTAAVNLVRSAPLVPYLPPKDRSIFMLTETYGKITSPVIPQTDPPSPDTVAFTDIFQTTFEQDRYFSPRFYALGQVDFQHDSTQGLNLEQVYGGGVGWTAIKSPKQELDLKGQVQYEKETFQTDSDNENLIAATISEAYTRNLPRKIVFIENGSILPAFNDPNAYSANASAGLNLPVWKRFNLTFTATDNFLNNPSAGYKKNNVQFVTGITYTLP
jgi:hypothetical protein